MRELQVVHRDDHLLVVDKPAGLPTTSPTGTGCLTELVAALDPGAPRTHPTSRLDAEVTGLVIFARTRRATRALIEARRTGAYDRRYLGLASAVPEPAAGTWTEWIGVDPADPRRRLAGEGGRPQAAETRYEVGAVVGSACAVALFPRTGRTHQLRVHAAHAGCALLGDVPYGGPRRVVKPDGRVVTPRRVMLHCLALRIPRVDGPGDLRLQAPPPEDLRRVWGELGGDEADLG